MRFWTFLILLTLGATACQAPTEKVNTNESLYDYDVEEKLSSLGIELKEPKPYKGLPIEHYVLIDNMLYLSGKGPVNAAGERITPSKSD